MTTEEILEGNRLTQKYHTGDRVKILVGHPCMWCNTTVPKPKNAIGVCDGMWVIDLRPHLVGLLATVVGPIENQGRWKYSLNVDGHGHVSWFVDSQLEPANKVEK